MPFVGIESRTDESVPLGHRQILLLHPAGDHVWIELTELENEMFSNGWAAPGESIQIDRRVRSIGSLAEDRDEQWEVFRRQQPVRFVDDRSDPHTTGRPAAQVVQTIHHRVPVSAEIAGELQGFRERPVDTLLSRQIAGVEAVDTPPLGFQNRQLPKNLDITLGNEEDPGLRSPRDVETSHFCITL